MRVLHLSTYDLQGGAARGAYRLHRGLRELGLDSQVLVQLKTGEDAWVWKPPSKVARALNPWRLHLDALPLRLYPRRRDALFSLAWLPNHLDGRVAALKPDILHLQWICDGFIPVAALARFKLPLVWMLHDCWPFTGGCHFPYECQGYEQSCGACPQLGSQATRDLSRRVWRRKARHWQNLDLSLIAPSHWMAACARKSALFRDRRIEVIPYGLDLRRYRPVNRQLAREILGLPQEEKLILCGAVRFTQDPRKGFNYLKEALHLLAAQGWDRKARLLIFGSSQPADTVDTGLPAIFLGTLHDDVSLVLAYSAADVFVVPSLQESFSLVILEAMACGTPAVAFHIGGPEDLIDHLRTGYLARPLEAADLAQGIEWVLADPQRQAGLGAAARAKVEQQFDITLVARQTVALYQQLIP